MSVTAFLGARRRQKTTVTGLLFLPAVLMSYSILLCGGTPAAAQQSAATNPTANAPAIPLAYVRRLALPPVRLTTRPDVPLAPQKPLTGKDALDPKRVARHNAARQAQIAGRIEFVQLRDAAVLDLQTALQKRLEHVAGLEVVPIAEVPPAATPMRQTAQEHSADAVLVVSVDRFGTRAGAERQVWLRAVAHFAPSREQGGLSSTFRNSFFVYGRATAVRRMLGKGYQKNDQVLRQEACRQASAQLVHLLTTGEEPPLARDERVGIVPTALPKQFFKQVVTEDERGQPTAIPVPTLARHADVFLQPELGPTTALEEPDEMDAALRALKLRPEDFWTPDGNPMPDRVRLLAEKLSLDYVFLSRVNEIALTERAVTVTVFVRETATNLRRAEIEMPGQERHAAAEVEALLLRVADGKVVWRDRREGTTTTRTEYVRQQPRLRGEEPCLLDAIRTAFAQLRFGFEEYKKRFEK